MIYVFIYLAVLTAGMAYGWRSADKSVNDQKIRMRLYVMFLIATVAGALAVRFFQNVYPDNLTGTAILKFCASLPSVVLAVKGYLCEKNTFDLKLTVALELCLVADMAINISLIAGGAIFAIAHLVFAYSFIREEKPHGKQLAVWLIVTGVIALLLLTQRKILNTTLLYILALTYLAVMISTVIFSRNLPSIIFLAAVVFAVSDCLLILNMIITPTLFTKIIALLVYYFSLLMYGIAIWEISYPGKRISRKETVIILQVFDKGQASGLVFLYYTFLLSWQKQPVLIK